MAIRIVVATNEPVILVRADASRPATIHLRTARSLQMHGAELRPGAEAEHCRNGLQVLSIARDAGGFFPTTIFLTRSTLLTCYS